jgi:hypothetical protein
VTEIKSRLRESSGAEGEARIPTNASWMKRLRGSLAAMHLGQSYSDQPARPGAGPPLHVYCKKSVFKLGLTQKPLRMETMQSCMQTRPAPADVQSASTVQRAAQACRPHTAPRLGMNWPCRPQNKRRR